MPVYALTDKEFDFATDLGRDRHKSNLDAGRGLGPFSSPEAATAAHVDSTRAHLAFSIMSGCPMNLFFGLRKGPPVPPFWIFTVTQHDHHLIVPPGRYPLDEPVVLVEALPGGRAFDAVGWIYAREAKTLGVKSKKRSDRPAWWVQRKDLHPMEAHPDFGRQVPATTGARAPEGQRKMASDTPNFEMEIDFGSKDFVPINVTMEPPPTGPYEAIVAECMRHEKDDGAVSIMFGFTVTEPGEGSGRSARCYIGTDQTKDFNVASLKTAYVSVGADPSKLKGKKKFKPEHFTGKKCFIYVTTPPEGEMDEKSGRQKLPDVRFQTKEQYQKQKEALRIAGGAPAQRPAPKAAPNGAPPAAPEAGADAGLADMFPS